MSSSGHSAVNSHSGKSYLDSHGNGHPRITSTTRPTSPLFYSSPSNYSHPMQFQGSATTQPIAPSRSPQHFHFQTVYNSDLIVNSHSGLNSPVGSPIGKTHYDYVNDEFLYEHAHEQMGLCQDERNGLADIMSCSMISPQNWEDVFSGEDDQSQDKYLVMSNEGERADAREMNNIIGHNAGGIKWKNTASNSGTPSADQIVVKSFKSCFADDFVEIDETFLGNERFMNERGASMPRTHSLADDELSEDDAFPVEKSMEKTGKRVFFAEKKQKKRQTKVGELSSSFEDHPHPSQSRESITLKSFEGSTFDDATLNTWNQKSGTEDEGTLSPDPHANSGKNSTTTPRTSLLQQTKERNHSKIKPYIPKIDIPDDESEASLLVLMRYMGCTPQPYGQDKNSGMDDDLPSGKEFIFDSEEDDEEGSTLSVGTYGSYSKQIWTMDQDEIGEGIEVVIDDFLSPSMLKIIRSLSLDESGVKVEPVYANSGLVHSVGSFLGSKSMDHDDSLHRPSVSKKDKPDLHVDTKLVTDLQSKDEEMVSPTLASSVGVNIKQKEQVTQTTINKSQPTLLMKSENEATETATRGSIKQHNISGSTSPTEDIIKAYLALPKNSRHSKETLIASLTASNIHLVKDKTESTAHPRIQCSSVNSVHNKNKPSSPNRITKKVVSAVKTKLSPTHVNINAAHEGLNKIMSDLSPTSTFTNYTLSPKSNAISHTRPSKSVELKYAPSNESADTMALISKVRKHSTNTAVKTMAQNYLNKYHRKNMENNQNISNNNAHAATTESLALNAGESSSFDKNDTVKVQKDTTTPSDTLHLSTSKGGPQLTTKKSVREVEDLLAKTRAWLVRHNEPQIPQHAPGDSTQKSSLCIPKVMNMQFEQRQFRLNGESAAISSFTTSIPTSDLKSVSPDISIMSNSTIPNELA